jgi:hypothetical protein
LLLLPQGGKQDVSKHANELLELLQGDSCSDDVAQSGVVDDATLARIMDRSHLLGASAPLPFAHRGVGYEVVAAAEGNLLSGVE